MKEIKDIYELTKWELEDEIVEYSKLLANCPRWQLRSRIRIRMRIEVLAWILIDKLNNVHN